MIVQILYFAPRMPSLKNISQEPLVHFLFIGLLIFILNGIFNSDQNSSADETLLIDDDDINRLITQYRQVWNEAPDESTIQKLIEQYIESEITYREALAMNLDHNDEIIKRRLKQKYEFLVKDLISSSEVSESELQTFYEDHKADFKTDRLYSFSQYYFSTDKRASPLEDAKEFSQIQQKTNPNHAVKSFKTDPIHLKQGFVNITEHQIRQEFGIDFLNQIKTQNPSSWTDPLSSGFGIHVVFMDSIGLSQTLEFEDVRDQVSAAYEEELTNTYNRNLLNKLKEGYDVEYDLNKWNNLIE